MKLGSLKALITGGGGGIGSAIAAELLSHGAQVLLVDRDITLLHAARDSLRAHSDRISVVVADLTNPADRTRLCEMARGWRGGVDTLINNAGLNHFMLFEEQSPQQIDAAIAVNVHAPLHLCRALLPHLKSRECAWILNTGSVFGAIGYPGYVTYSATKFALRGFTEALRRELAGTTVSVHYLAPRATRTPINSSNVERMNAELGVAMDPPDRVARAAVALLSAGRRDATIGWPEKLFVRLNALFPGLVDSAIQRQLPIIESYARLTPASKAMPDAASIPVETRRHGT